MKRWFILVLLCMVVASIASCGHQTDNTSAKIAQSHATPSANVGKGIEYFFPINCRNRFGVIDQRGNVLIEPRYSSISAVLVSNDQIFTYGMGQTSVLISDQYQDELIFVSSEGTEIFPRQLFPYSRYVNLGDSLFAAFTTPGAKNRDHYDQFALVPVSVFDPTHRWTPPEGYLPRMTIAEGRVPVSKNGKFGFCDRNGKVILPAQYDLVRPFSEGLAAVCDNGKWGFVDLDGTLQISPQFEDVGDFSDGFTLTKSFGEATGFFIDPQGKKHQEFYRDPWAISVLIKIPWESNLAPISDATSKLEGVVNRDMDWVIPPRFVYIKRFSEGFAVAKPEPSKYSAMNVSFSDYLIDTSGSLTGPITTGIVNWSNFRYGLLGARDGHLYVDKTGHRVGECTRYGKWKSYVRADAGPAQRSDPSTPDEKKMMATQKSIPNDDDE